MFSYWEQQVFFHYDYIIVGAGIVGLSTAIELKDKFPHASIVVLERGFFTSGASSRNAGFACMGSVSELLDDLKNLSVEKIITLFEWRKRGLEKLRNRLGDKNIDYTENGSYELIGENEMHAIDEIDYLNKLLLPITGKPAFALANDKIDKFGFAKNKTLALIENTCEGELHPGKMMRALTYKAMQAGIEIKTGIEVTGFDEQEKTVLVKAKIPFSKKGVLLKASVLVFCTNAFTKQFFPEEELIPGRGQVFITHPIDNLPFKGVFHFDKGYYYFREINGRVLFGGGRNLDLEGETTSSFGLNKFIQNDLEQKLKNNILPGRQFSIDQRWSGIMAFGPNKFPIVKCISNRIYGAYRLGGMGIALGSEVARQVVVLIGNHSEKEFKCN